MKIKEGFLLRQVADNWVVLPVGQACVDFNGMLSLNDSGALLWKALEQGGDREALADAFNKYDVNSPRKIGRNYRKNTRKLKRKINLRCIKRPFMYNGLLRSLVMKSGLTAIKIKTPKSK